MIKKHPGPDKSGVLFCFLPQESGNGSIFRVEFGGRQGTEQGQQGVLHCGSCFTLAFEFLFFLLEGGQFGVFHQGFEFVRLGVFSVRIPEDTGKPAAFFFRAEQGIVHESGCVCLSSRFPASCLPLSVER